MASDFIYRDRLFQEEQMYTRLKAIAQDREYTEMYRALTYMREHHEGQFRKPGKHGDAHVPYINHPLMMLCWRRCCYTMWWKIRMYAWKNCHFRKK